MWVVFGFGLFVALGFLILLIVSCCLSPSSAGRMSRWYAPLSDDHSAEGRAHALLHEVLGEAQYQQVLTCGYLDVTSPSLEDRVYRIPSTGGLVTVYEHGRAIMRLCLQPTQPLPKADVVVMHKLLIEANEQEYLQKANQLSLR
jgi:hypothetical protein